MPLTVLPVDSGLNSGLTLVEKIKIPGVKIRTAVNVSNGPRNEQEIVGEDGNTAAFVFSQEGQDIAVTGYVGSDATLEALKSGIDVKVEGLAETSFAVLSGVSINFTPEGVTTFSGTVKVRVKAQEVTGA